MRFLILSDMFSLDSWLIQDREPVIMPAVYEFFTYLGNSKEHSFVCIIFHHNIKKTISFNNGSVIHIVPLSIPFHYLRKIFSMFAMYGIAKKQLKEHSFDIVYGLGIYSIISAHIGKRYRLLSVSRIFGSLVNDLLEKKNRYKLYSRHLFQYLEIKYPSDIIICTEDGTKFDNALQILNPGKAVYMLYNGINLELKTSLLNIPIIKKVSTDEVIHFYSIGRLTYWKRHDLAIKTIHELKETYNLKLKLTILGKGEEKKRLVKLVKQLHLSDEVEFKSPIPHHQMPAFLEHQHIGLFLYDVSNMGNAFWESCISGRLIFTRRNGKIDSLFPKNTSLIIESNEVPNIAYHIFHCIGRIIEDDVILVRNTITQKIVRWKERFENELSIIKQNRDSYF